MKKRTRITGFHTAVLFLFMALLSPCFASGTVRVEGGLVSGTAEGNITVYKGIPFAAPPVGELRWKAPQPVLPWEGVLSADSYAPACPQLIYPNTASMNNGNISDMSEDCLYLNIWTPAESAAEKLPVMVWIHGGGFALGASYVANYEGMQLAKKGVVVVSIAYRLGVFGFLADPQLSAESETGTSGNYGLLDQLAALKWVKNNIAAFGGDNDNITIFGESAGAISVSMLCGSPLAKGLFNRTISQSGGNLGPVVTHKRANINMQNLKGAEEQGSRFIARMGASSLAELRAIPAEKFLQDQEAVTMGGFWPVCDGVVIADDQYKLYSQGNYNDVDVIIGTNSNEGSMFIHGITAPQLEAGIRAGFGALAEKALQVYPATDDATALQSAADIFRDTSFAWPSWTWAKLQQETGKSGVYVYFFDQNQPPMKYGTPQKNATHTDEINYVFGNINDNYNYQYTDDDRKLSELMMNYWVNFAKTGNPNTKGLPEWPEFQDSTESVMCFKGTEPFLIHLPNLPQLKFLSEYYASVRESE